MPQHRRRRIGPLVRRSTYLDLWRAYQDLLRDHRALEEDHQRVLEDHEGLLYDMEETAEVPVSGPVLPHVPSWAETEELPVLRAVEAPLDPSKADSLVRRIGMLDSPSGSWGVAEPENG